MSHLCEIHPNALVEPGAKMGAGCRVGPFAYVEAGAEMGENCRIESHAVIKKHAILGEEVIVGHFSVVGGEPQHLSFDPAVSSKTVLGNMVRLGEGVTIHRSIEEGGVTLVGENSFLMGYSHVAHDCHLGERVIMANGALLGGHVLVGSDVFLGGGAAVHQFVRIGAGAMIGGLAEVSQNVPPQVLLSGRNEICGLNLVGLRRRNYPREDISILKSAYSRIYQSGNLVGNAENFIDSLDGGTSCNLAKEFARFFTPDSRGYARPRSKSQ